MAHYLIKNSDNRTILLKQFDLNDSFSFNPKMKENAKVKITEINIIDKKMIDDIVTKKILAQYQKIFKMVYFYTNSDEATDEDAKMCLDQVDYLKSVIENKYQKYLSIEKYKYLMDELYSLSIAVNKKVIINQISRNMPTTEPELEEEKRRGM